MEGGDIGTVLMLKFTFVKKKNTYFGVNGLSYDKEQHLKTFSKMKL